MKLKIVGRGKIGKIFLERFKEEIVEQVNFAKELDSKIKCDIVIDFSHPDNLDDLLDYCINNHLPLVIGTTGYNIAQEKKIFETSNIIPICKDVNFSEGIMRLKKIIKEFYNDYKVIHITETHRLDKLDAPSGTALMLKRYILNLNPNIEVMIRSVRKGDVCGIHKVTFINEDEEISIIHKANNRYIFVDGAYYAAFLMLKRGSGLYSFEGIVND